MGLWDTTLSLSAGVGYKDNILLGPVPVERSGFIASGLDASLMRLPLDGTRFIAFLTGTDQRYFTSKQVDAEETLVVFTQLKKDFGEAWQVGMTCQSAYLDQVLDVTDVEGEFGAVRAQGFNLTVRPSLRRNLTRECWLELELTGTRQYFKAPLDDYWEGGPKLTVGRTFGPRSEWTFGVEVNQRGYDQREQRMADGTSVAGATLSFLQPGCELAWQRHWDAKRRWRTTTRLSYLGNLDNGSGYFDYSRLRISEQLRYRTDSWEFRGQVRYAFYGYGTQPVSVEDLSLLNRNDVDLSLRVERRLSKNAKVFVEYEHDRSISNQSFSEYAANTGTAGIDWEF
jgi:hypothetical protein